ncbi:TnpV protein, partial [Dysosmobacter welbionis]
ELHRRLAHLVHGLAAADVLRRIHAHLPAQGHNVAVALAFCLHRRLSGCVVSAVLALCAGRLTGSAVALRRGFSTALVPVLASRVPGGVNLSLELVKLRLLLAGQAPALVPGAGHNRPLSGDHFL